MQKKVYVGVSGRSGTTSRGERGLCVTGAATKAKTRLALVRPPDVPAVNTTSRTFKRTLSIQGPTCGATARGRDNVDHPTPYSGVYKKVLPDVLEYVSTKEVGRDDTCKGHVQRSVSFHDRGKRKLPVV